jgi:hypothetical protein
LKFIYCTVFPEQGSESTISSFGGYRSLNCLVSSMDEEKSIQQRQVVEEKCIRTSSLGTPMDADTQAFGTMFTVESQADAMQIIAMEIHAVSPANQTDDMSVEVYTRLGDYSAVVNAPNMWTKIVDTTVAPGRQGRGILIPESDFKKVTMQSGELRSFYVTLKESNLRYTSTNVTAGTEISSDGMLQVNVGVGLSQYGFQLPVFPGRTFNGRFYYTHVTDCQLPRIKTPVVYTVHVRSRPQMNRRRVDLQAALNDLTKTTMETIIQGIVLKDLRDKCALSLDDIDTMSSAVFSDQDAPCPVEGWAECTSYDTTMSFSHLDTVTSGRVMYSILKIHDDAVLEMNSGSDAMDVVYAGKEPLSTQVLLAMKGVPSGVLMNDAQQRFLAEELNQHLTTELLGMIAPTVLGADIVAQRGPDVRRRLAAANWIEVTVDFLSSYTPPLDSAANFGYVAIDALRKEQDLFMEDLKSGSEQPGSIVAGSDGNYFKNVREVLFQLSPSSTAITNRGTPLDQQKPPVILGISRFWFIVLCGAVILVTGGWFIMALVFGRRRKQFIQLRQINSSSGERSRSPSSHASKRKSKNPFERSRTMSTERRQSPLYSEPTDRPDMLSSKMVGRQQSRPLVRRSTSSSPERHVIRTKSSERPLMGSRKSSSESAGRSSLDVQQNSKAVFSTSERTNRGDKQAGDAGGRSASLSRLQGQAVKKIETATGRIERQRSQESIVRSTTLKRERSGASTSNQATRMDRELSMERQRRHASIGRSRTHKREQSATSRSDQATRVNKEPVKRSAEKDNRAVREQQMNRLRGLEPSGRSSSLKMKQSASANREGGVNNPTMDHQRSLESIGRLSSQQRSKSPFRGSSNPAELVRELSQKRGADSDLIPISSNPIAIYSDANNATQTKKCKKLSTSQGSSNPVNFT